MRYLDYSIKQHLAWLNRNVPEDMKRLRFWCNFNIEGTRKVPYGVDGRRLQGTQGTSEDFARLGSFDDACERVRRGRAQAVGFSFREGCGYSLIDFDGLGSVIRHVDILDKTWSETSFGGEGAHSIVRGNLETNRKDHERGVELFSTKGNVLITGWPHTGTDCGTVGSKHIAAPLLRINGEPYAPTHARAKSLPDVDTPQNIEKLKRALAAIDCHDISDDDWMRITQAAHSMNPAHDGEPFRLWDRWCRTGEDTNKEGNPRYDKKNNIERWDSCGQQRGTTLATAIKMAKDTGNWEEPPRPKRRERSKSLYDKISIGEADRIDTGIASEPIKGLVYEGLTLLVGKAKITRKSFFALQCAVQTSLGDPFLGYVPSQPLRVVLYMLEEGAAFDPITGLEVPPVGMIKKRLHAMGLYDLALRGNVKLRFNLFPLDDGGLEQLDEDAAVSDLIFIDSIQKIYNESAGKELNATLKDYYKLEPLNSLGIKHHCGIVVICHAGKDSDKREAEDAIATTSGTNASATGTLVLQRQSEEGNVKLTVHSRGFPEHADELYWNNETVRYERRGPWLGGNLSRVLDIVVQATREKKSAQSTLQISRSIHGAKAEQNRSNINKLLLGLRRNKLVEFFFAEGDTKTKLWTATPQALAQRSDE